MIPFADQVRYAEALRMFVASGGRHMDATAAGFFNSNDFLAAARQRSSEEPKRAEEIVKEALIPALSARTRHAVVAGFPPPKVKAEADFIMGMNVWLAPEVQLHREAVEALVDEAISAGIEQGQREVAVATAAIMIDSYDLLASISNINDRGQRPPAESGVHDEIDE